MSTRWRPGAGRWARPLWLVAGSAILGILVAQFGLTAAADALRHVSPSVLLAYLACGLIARVGYCVRWASVVRAVGGRASFGRLFAARLAGDAVGMLVPSGKLAGEPVRVGLVYAGGSSAGGTSGTLASAGVGLDRILEIVSNTACAIAYVSIFSLTRTWGAPDAAHWVVLSLLAVLAAITVLLFLLRRGDRPLAFLYNPGVQRRLPRLARWMTALQDTEEQLARVLREHPGLLFWGLIGSLLIEGLIIVEYYLLLSAFGVRLEFPTLLLTMVGSGVARAAPTPAGIGALEAVQVGVSVMASEPAAIGFLVGVVLRLHETLWMGIGLIALAASGWSLQHRAAARKAAA